MVYSYLNGFLLIYFSIYTPNTFLAFSFACFLNCWKESAVDGLIEAPATWLFASVAACWANELQTLVAAFTTLWSDSCLKKG